MVTPHVESTKIPMKNQYKTNISA